MAAKVGHGTERSSSELAGQIGQNGERRESGVGWTRFGFPDDGDRGLDRLILTGAVAPEEQDATHENGGGQQSGATGNERGTALFTRARL